MSVLVVTGTGTGIGKTMVTAALGAVAGRRAGGVAVVKPAQTGVGPGEPGDVDLIRDLTGITEVHELVRYPDPLAPAAAARRAGQRAVGPDEIVSRIAKLAEARDLVLVEGAGGLLVRYDDGGATLADVAVALGARMLVVAPAGLGALNATALTLEAMAHRGIILAGVVIGSWPDDPDLACRCNIRDLEELAGRPLAGAVPAGAGRLDRAAFHPLARSALEPALGGTFDAGTFREKYSE